MSVTLGIMKDISTKTQNLNCKEMIKYIPLKSSVKTKQQKLEGQHRTCEEGFARMTYKGLTFQIQKVIKTI